MTVTSGRPEVAMVSGPAPGDRRPADVKRPGVDLGSFTAARGPALLRLAWLLTGDPDAAQDLVQEALARVLPRWAKISAGGDPEAYLRAAIRSAWIDRWRRQRWALPLMAGRGEDEDPRPGTAHDGGVEGTAERLDLSAALARLTVRQRTVLVLRFYEDLTEAQTALAMGCSANTVKSQVRYALGRLREVAPELMIVSEEVDR